MRLLLISRGDVFPPVHGAASRIVNTAKYISREGCEVVFLPSRSNSYYIFHNGSIKEVEFSPFLKGLRSNYDRISEILSKMEIPVEDHILYEPLLSRELMIKAASLSFFDDFDIVQAEFPAFAIPAMFARRVRLRKRIRQVLVEHNVEFERIGISSPQISKRGIKNLKRIERLACRLSHSVVCVSGEDRKKLEATGIKGAKITVIPHGVDLENYADLKGREIRQKLGIPDDAIVLFYHGVYNYKPNRDALFRIVNNILPPLRLKNIKVVCIGAGQNPPEDMNREGVILTGAVESLPDFIDAADICIVPLMGGGGTRLKVLEYFAAKKPLISTAKGVEGFDIKDGVEFIRAEKDEEFVRHIQQFAVSKERYMHIAENGYRFVQSYDWSFVARQYINLYQSLISQ
jgi:glycosyltransferase involved in cell wall biosynthesis